jgi:Pyruvate/2-oxoacid:ferredoxin oxidoreductase delta subunit
MATQRLTVVLSRWPGSDPAKRQCEEQVVAALGRDAQIGATAVPHLYYLYPDDPALRSLKAASGELVVLAWLYPRATRWVLHYHGIGEHPQRRISCFDLRADRDAQSLVAEIKRLAESVPTDVAVGSVTGSERALEPRWYPVIDLSRCANCLECLDFCLFGVFGVNGEGHVFVEDGDACKPGCPACARVCPQGAIVFPECPTAVIAGGEGAAPVARGGIEGSSPMAHGPVVKLTVGGREHTGAAPADSLPPAEREPAGQDELDKLIDEFEGLNL